MVAHVVQKNVDDRQQRVQRFERFQKPVRQRRWFRLRSAGFPGFQVKSDANIDTLPSARLLDCQLFFLGRPAANRLRGMGWMKPVQEQHGLVWAKRVQKLLVTFDERLLLFRMAGILAKPKAARMQTDFLKFETSPKTPICSLIQSARALRRSSVRTGVSHIP